MVSIATAATEGLRPDYQPLGGVEDGPDIALGDGVSRVKAGLFSGDLAFH